MDRNCHYCQSKEVRKGEIIKDWIVEHHYLGAYGRTLKECLIGGSGSSEKRELINTVYYCSMTCMENQQDKEEKELWKKGNCRDCKTPLAVINDNCQNLEHKKLGCLFPIKNTPDCLKKK